jgi:NAD(P)-dependent dehydrogenase (short-subunit alcohol dehydrogenase family)
MGFMRCVADSYKHDGIRVNALCPGAVRTPIVPDRAWEAMPEDVFTPMELISELVLKLAAGVEIVDSNGIKVSPDELFGQAVVANGKNIYIQPVPPYCDNVMERTLENTRMGKQTSV